MMHGRLANVSPTSGTFAYPQEAGAALHYRRRWMRAWNLKDLLQM